MWLCVVILLLNRVQIFATPLTVAHKISLSFTISQSLLKLMCIESVMLSKHLILCHPLLLLPSAFPSIRVFSSESVLRIRCPKYWSFSSSIHGIFQARILEWVAISFSRGSSWPRDWTRVSCTTGRHSTVWATREAQILYDSTYVRYLI